MALLFSLTFASAGALHFDSLAEARARALAEAARAREAVSEAVARAEAAQQKVKDLGAADSADRPFWFWDLFPDQVRDAQYRKDPWVVGPTPIDDLGNMYAAIKETRPKTMVEVGFYMGDGARAFLSAADAGATVHSFDPFPPAGEVEKLKAQMPGIGRNFVFHQKPGEEITSEDVGGSKVGFAFIDAAHNATQNKLIFERLLPLLTDDAIIAVHDTGGWGKKFLDDHMGEENARGWWWFVEEDVKKKFPWAWPLSKKIHGKGDEQYYVPPAVNQERIFVNWVKRKYPEWGIMNFHSLNTLRAGITMMQRQRLLEMN